MACRQLFATAYAVILDTQVFARLALLLKTFAIDVCAFSAMSNHGHWPLKINETVAQWWNDEIVIPYE